MGRTYIRYDPGLIIVWMMQADVPITADDLARHLIEGQEDGRTVISFLMALQDSNEEKSQSFFKAATLVLSEMVVSGLAKRGEYCQRGRRYLQQYHLQKNMAILKDALQPMFITLTPVNIPQTVIEAVSSAISVVTEPTPKAGLRALAATIRDCNEEQLQALSNDMKISIDELKQRAKEWEKEGFSN